MKKLFHFLCILFTCQAASVFAYDSLNEGLIEKIFSKKKTNNVLEFGMGRLTEFFLESCNKVVSVEIVTNGYGPDNYKRCLDYYRNFSNWIPIAYFSGYKDDVLWAPYKFVGTDAVFLATSYQNSTQQNYALIDDFYLTELNSFISRQVKTKSINVAVVNGEALYLRGDLVQLLFNKVPVIIAYETGSRANPASVDVYGYQRVKTPDEYQEIPLNSGTIWIKKTEDLKELINEIQKK